MITCDDGRCGPAVEALVTVKSPAGLTLDFCAHHYNEYALTLLAAEGGSWTVLEDRREKLTNA